MASASSFLSHLGGRPPLYRTPSPPRRAVEPISPSFNPDGRISWNERSAFPPSDIERDAYLQSSDSRRASNGVGHRQHPSVDSRVSHAKSRHGHHRSASTIDTLATIALATSPTFAPLPYDASSPHNTAAAGSPPMMDHPDGDDERPAKRARSEKDGSPTFGRIDARPFTSHASVPDSMKTDAELLLNFARPSNFLSRPPVPKTSTSNDGPYRHYGAETKWSMAVGFTGGYDPSQYAFPENGFSPSRIRSHSDGAAALARPVIPGLRPNTSSSTLPPVTWDGEDAKYSGNETTRAMSDGHNKNMKPLSHSTSGLVVGVVPETKEEDADSDDSSQASCAACNLVRISINGEDQGEVTWINCDGCKRWFHIVCAGFKNDREVRTVDKFICRECRPVHGQTTFVRKSSRARTAIDYAGLNQGLVKTSTDSPEHHYIQPIKEGKIRFLPENFPRMRAELVTAEFFERGVGMTEPVIIPASLNPRNHVASQVDPDFENLVGEAPTQEMFDELLEHLPDDANSELVVDCGQDLLDMVVPQGLTVRTVAELYGPEERVEVIDVKSQQGEEKKWNMQKWADYYESTGSKVVRNVISLEVSQSPLGRLIRRPKIVRDLDLQDAVWPEELKAIGDYPKVQFYCLMSVADCYTDFHIDFGGSSVYYTILKGKKTFFFIPPKEKHLKKYEEWCNSPAQDTTFLGDQTKECYRVDLEEGDTMLIPAGWIHAVWTPENSLVIGGNFLTRMNYGMQIKVAKIEKDTKVPRKFRYPFFQKIQWYTALKYLEDDPIPDSILEAFARDEHFRFYREIPIYYEFGERANAASPGTGYYNARFYSQAELEGLPELAKYLLRTALIAGGYSVEGVTMEARNAVKRSIPKIQGDPIDIVRKFGVWVAWKRGNEPAASWTRPGVITANFKLEQLEKKPAGRPSRRSERHADAQRMYAERQGLLRLSDQPSDASNWFVGSVSVPSDNSTPVPHRASISNPPPVKEEAPKVRNVNKGSGLGPKRVACDACRKRRIRCRHKDEQNDTDVVTPASARPMTTPNVFDSTEIQNQSILARDAASVLNALASVATETGLHDGSNGLAVNRFEGYPADGRFPALLDMQRSAISRPTDGSPNGVDGGKKGRSKACEECRKSKVCRSYSIRSFCKLPFTDEEQRRCIHDEYGRIDPIKAQERSKPRAAASSKRPRPSDDGTVSTTHKKPKVEPSSAYPADVAHMGYAVAVASVSDPGHNGFVEAENEQIPGVSSNVQSPPAETVEPEHKIQLTQATYGSPPAVKADIDADTITPLPMQQPAEPATSLVSPPTSLAGEMDVSPEQGNTEMHQSVEGGHDALDTPTSSSRHSSRQPRQVERYVPEVLPPRSTNKPSARHPSTGATKSTSAPSSTMKKPISRPTSSHAKKSASPALDKKSMSSMSPRVPHSKTMKQRLSFAESEADAESLRLIRELQEQDFGLRKRSTRV
jgi:F-box/leucine-rich repeat protein 10/11